MPTILSTPTKNKKILKYPDCNITDAFLRICDEKGFIIELLTTRNTHNSASVFTCKVITIHGETYFVKIYDYHGKRYPFDAATSEILAMQYLENIRSQLCENIITSKLETTYPLFDTDNILIALVLQFTWLNLPTTIVDIFDNDPDIIFMEEQFHIDKNGKLPNTIKCGETGKIYFIDLSTRDEINKENHNFIMESFKHQNGINKKRENICGLKRNLSSLF